MGVATLLLWLVSKYSIHLKVSMPSGECWSY